MRFDICAADLGAHLSWMSDPWNSVECLAVCVVTLTHDSVAPVSVASQEHDAAMIQSLSLAPSGDRAGHKTSFRI